MFKELNSDINCPTALKINDCEKSQFSLWHNIPNIKSKIVYFNSPKRTVGSQPAEINILHKWNAWVHSHMGRRIRDCIQKSDRQNATRWNISVSCVTYLVCCKSGIELLTLPHSSSGKRWRKNPSKGQRKSSKQHFPESNSAIVLPYHSSETKALTINVPVMSSESWTLANTSCTSVHRPATGLKYFSNCLYQR